MKDRQIPFGRGLLYGLYQSRLKRWLQTQTGPKHVAMIIDGNRRWARQRGLESVAHGHTAGAAKMHEFLTWCDELGVEVVTLYLLSADNLSNRTPAELADLTAIIADLSEDLSHYGNWRVQHVGRTEGLPQGLVDKMLAAEKHTVDHDGLHINLAVGYGGRAEIADAVRSIVRSHSEAGGTLDNLADDLTPELIAEHLYTQGSRIPTSSSAPRASSGSATSCCGRAPTASSTSSRPSAPTCARWTFFAPFETSPDAPGDSASDPFDRRLRSAVQ